VFCRGACWTPLDALGLDAPPAAYREALTRARAAGMNMLRLPGNLLYEQRLFHDLCDELGILVWQEFMFANMDYPHEAEGFVASVRAEAAAHLAELMTSPSLAVLCGGSEVEQQAAMLGLPREEWQSPLFHQHLPELCAQYRPDVPYLPASPSGGAFPFAVNAGVCHYYGVGAYLRPLDDARRSEVRFAAECLAFANIPEDSTLMACFGTPTPAVHQPRWKARVPRDGGAGWDFDDVRDHYVRELFAVDPARLRYSDPGRYLLLGKVACGEVLASTFAEWRRAGSRCRGALVWLYRDLWAGAGWGLIDALGTPKSVYYHLRRVLQPLSLLLTDEGLNGLYAHLVNDTAQEHPLTLAVSLYRDGQVVVAHGSEPVTLAPRSARAVPLARLFAGFLDTSYAYRFGPPGHDLVVARLLGDGGAVVSEPAFSLPLGLALPAQPELGLGAQAQRRPDGSVALQVRTLRFAQSVIISAADFVPSDNYFHLEPGGERLITLQPRRPGAPLRGTLTAVNTHASPVELKEAAGATDTDVAEAAP
jgi:beta-mannosidase